MKEEIEKLKKVLTVISKVAMVADEDEKDPNWSKVYKLSHAFSGTCENTHEDWQGELEKVEKELENI